MDKNEYKNYLKNNIPVMGYNLQAFGFFYKNFNTPDDKILASKGSMEKLNIVRRICKNKGLSPQQVMFDFFRS